MARAIWSLVAFLALALAAPAAVGAAGQYSVIAQQRGVRLAGGDVTIRLADVSLSTGIAPVTHTHAPGFAYAVVEPHALTVRGQRNLLGPGQAAWVGDGEEHTHARGSETAGRFYFVGVFPAAARGVLPAALLPTVLHESESFRLDAGAYDVALGEARLPAAGDAVALPPGAGPVGLALVEGQASFAGQALPAAGVVVVPPGQSGALANAGAAGARIVTLAVLPAAATAPAQLPRTGSPDPALLLLSGLGLAAVGRLVVLRPRHGAGPLRSGAGRRGGGG